MLAGVQAQLKQQYNDRAHALGSAQKQLRGRDWYCQQAFRALNQVRPRELCLLNACLCCMRKYVCLPWVCQRPVVVCCDSCNLQHVARALFHCKLAMELRKYSS